MILSFMRKTWEKTSRDNGMLIIANLVLAIIAAAAVFHTLSLKEKTILVPPNLDKTVVVGWNSANADYYRGFGLYFATLVGNITPGNATFVADSLAQFVDATIYPEIRKKIYELSADPVFRNAAGTSQFLPGRVFFEPETGKTFVTGQQRIVNAGGRNKDESRPLTYEFSMVMRDSHLWVVAIDSYDGLEPHTLKWIESHPKPEVKPGTAPVAEAAPPQSK